MKAHRVAMVSGASRGLGHLLAREFVRNGYALAACARSPRPPDLDECLYSQVDVGDPPLVDHFVRDALRRFGRIDVLVNDAGFANPPAPIEATDDDVVGQCFATNVLGPAAFLKRVVPVMVRQPEGGVIISIASRAGVTPVPGLAAYSASKTALVALTLAVAKEVAESRILCVSVCPAGMNTEMRASVYGKGDADRQMDPRLVVDLVMELATRRTAKGVAVPSGSAILISSETGPVIRTWSKDDRGFESLSLEGR